MSADKPAEPMIDRLTRWLAITMFLAFVVAAWWVRRENDRLTAENQTSITDRITIHAQNDLSIVQRADNRAEIAKLKVKVLSLESQIAAMKAGR